jgi:hypothetical protein
LEKIVMNKKQASSIAALAALATAVVAGCGASSDPPTDESADENALAAGLTPEEASLVREAQGSAEMTRHVETLRAFGWKVPAWRAATVQHATAAQLAAAHAEPGAPTMVVRVPVTTEAGGKRHTVDVLYAGDGMALFRPVDAESATHLHEVLKEADAAKLQHATASDAAQVHPESVVETESVTNAASPYWQTWWVYKKGAFWACWNSDNWLAAFFATQYVVGTGQGWIRTWDGCAWVDPGRWLWSTHWAACGFISHTCSGYPVTYT